MAATNEKYKIYIDVNKHENTYKPFFLRNGIIINISNPCHKWLSGIIVRTLNLQYGYLGFKIVKKMARKSHTNHRSQNHRI